MPWKQHGCMDVCCRCVHLELRCDDAEYDGDGSGRAAPHDHEGTKRILAPNPLYMSNWVGSSLLCVRDLLGFSGCAAHAAVHDRRMAGIPEPDVGSY